ncbi:MAG: hypothetical protein UV38_C0002G0079 [candidate division TM6 bacterium GW2011_GWE2_42_60]|nr:MAG: hypothetical protein UV38_C0002G0079 [candidate division TM6 bacterium GW2011_GWE2_42_60]
MKKQIFLVVLLLFLFGSLRSSEIRYDKDTIKLDLSEQKVTDEQLQKIVDTCHNLEKLNLDSVEGFTYVGLQDVLDKCTKLTDLSLWGCKIEFENLNGNKFKNLKYLSLAYSTITDKGLQNIVKNGLNLDFLFLTSTEITGEGIDWRMLSKLTFLDLGETEITDKCLEKISTACKMLEDLELRQTKITQLGLLSILNTCVNISKLIVSRCKYIDFEKLDWSKLNKLKILYLAGTNITETGLQKILVCPNLTYLVLLFCENLPEKLQKKFDGEEAIQKLKEQFSPFPDFARALSAAKA